MDVHPYSPCNTYLGQVRPFLPSFGAAEVNDTGNRCVLDQPTAHETFDYVRHLVGFGSGHAGGSRRIPHLVEGKAAFAMLAGVHNRRLRTTGAGKLRPAPFPTGRTRRQIVIGMWAAVRTDCVDPAFAWRFVQHFGRCDTQRTLAESHCLFPARRDAIEHLLTLDEEAYAPLIDRLGELESVTPALSRADVFYLSQILEDWRVTRDVPALLTRACEKFNERLRRQEHAGLAEVVGL